jgi:hypothetical protein
LSEAAFGLPRFKGYAIQQEAVVRNSQEETTVRQPVLKLIPRDFKLAFGALVLKTIKPNVLHQDVQAVNKSASRRIPIFSLGCGGGGNTRLLKLRSKVNAQDKGMHVTEVIVLK